jgi:hypothetical protein
MRVTSVIIFLGLGRQNVLTILYQEYKDDSNNAHFFEKQTFKMLYYIDAIEKERADNSQIADSFIYAVLILCVTGTQLDYRFEHHQSFPTRMFLLLSCYHSQYSDHQ